jgi:gluconolactonase
MLDRPARVFFDGMLSDPQLDHAEGVAVAADGGVWCGGERGQIFRVEPDGSAIEQVATTDGFCVGVAFAPDGALFVCDVGHAAIMRVDAQTGRVERFAEQAGGRRLRVPNYPAFDVDGRLYVSDSRAQGDPGPGLYRFDPDGRGELWYSEPLDFANGLALAPGGDALYVVESWGRRVVRIAIEADGSAGAADTFVDLPGTIPDGLAFAADGALYVALYQPSRVLRVEPDGSIGVVAEDPDAHLLCHPTNIAFHGTDLIATNLGRWHLTVIEAGVEGVPLPPVPGGRR